MTRLRNLSLATKIYRLSGTVVLLFLLVIGFLFHQWRESLYDARRDEIRHLVDSAWQILEYYAQRAAEGRISLEEARERALELIRRQHFEVDDYIWISDLTPRMVMHPSPELVGQELAAYRDPSGRQLFLEMVEVVGQDGAGFFEYLWPRPGRSEPLMKISFVKGFPPWGWVIGAGFYVEDIDSYLGRILWGAGTVLFAVIAGALLLVTYVARSISVPMGQAVRMIESLQKGDLGHRLRLEQHDEVGRLAKAMDAFADNLQDEILTAFDHLAQGDFSFQAKGLIREPLARANSRLNALVDDLDRTVATTVEERTKTEALIAAIGEGVAIFGLDMRFVYQNPIHIGMVGNHVGEPCFAAYENCDNGCDKCLAKQSLHDGKIHKMERCIATRDGDLYLDVTASPVWNAAGEIVSVIELSRDVTSKKRAETALIDSEARYSSLFQDNHAVMMLIDPVTAAIVDANPSACAFYGYSREQMLGMKISEINTLSTGEVIREMEVACAERRWKFYFRHRLASGEERDVEVYSGPIQVKGKELLYSLVHDVTERTQAEARVKYLAFHDPLTGLANRALLEDRLALTLAHARRHNEEGALFFIDLDRFKVINDSLGHHAGDLLLQEVASRLKALVRSTDTVCRSGGDEFILLFPHLATAADAAHMAEKILASFTHPFILEENEVIVSPSIGISFYPGDGTDSATLSRNADAAMYAAKQQGRNNYQFFKPELTSAAQERLLLENDLRKALAGDGLQLHYQPQFHALSGKIVGVEALARWYHPSMGWVPPAKFIPIAEECGLIDQLGAWVLKIACAQNRQWQQSGFEPIRMAVNVSGRQFRQADFIDVVDAVLAETGLESRWLEVEVTENVLMEDVGETIQTLTDLKVRAISLAIDDFGTGYSSLSYLRQFSIDRLKIDRSFVAKITSNPDDAAIASAVLGLAKTLNLEVIAEGVETAEQALFLWDRQCDIMQGYYFGRPAPAEEIVRLLANPPARDLVATGEDVGGQPRRRQGTLHG